MAPSSDGETAAFRSSDNTSMTIECSTAAEANICPICSP